MLIARRPGWLIKPQRGEMAWRTGRPASKTFWTAAGRRSATPLWQAGPLTESGVAAALCHRSPKSSISPRWGWGGFVRGDGYQQRAAPRLSANRRAAPQDRFQPHRAAPCLLGVRCAFQTHPAVRRWKQAQSPSPLRFNSSAWARSSRNRRRAVKRSSTAAPRGRGRQSGKSRW